MRNRKSSRAEKRGDVKVDIVANKKAEDGKRKASVREIANETQEFEYAVVDKSGGRGRRFEIPAKYI